MIEDADEGEGKHTIDDPVEANRCNWNAFVSKWHYDNHIFIAFRDEGINNSLHAEIEEIVTTNANDHGFVTTLTLYCYESYILSG